MNELQKRFKEAEVKIRELLIKAFYSNKSTAQVRKIVIQDLELLIKYLDDGSTEYVEKEVLERFKTGLADTSKKLLAEKFVESSAINLGFVVNFAEAPQNIKDSVIELIASYKESYSDVYKATRSTTKKALSDIFRMKNSLKDGLSPEIRKRAWEIARQQVGKDFFTEKSMDKISEEIAKKFEKLIGKKGIMFRDRAGRSWSYSRYAEMMTREISATSYREGQRAMFVQVGIDVVKTNHTGTTDSCLEWEGKLFSLTGATPGFPTYDEIRNDGTHMFGVGCRHEIIRVSESEVLRYLDKG